MLGVPVVIAVMAVVGRPLSAQQARGPAAPPRHPSPAQMSQATLDDMLIQFPLPAGQEAYADIDGKRMHRDVVELANIARRYRDQGHPKFWGRITGSSADAEGAAWMLAKFKAAGLTDVRSQPFDLSPQWFPQSWELGVSGGGKTIVLDSAQPHYASVGTPAAGLDLEAVYAGLGSEADFIGRDVKGKAVFVFSMLGAPEEGAVRRGGRQGRRRHLRSRHAAWQHALSGLPLGDDGAGLHRRSQRRRRGAPADRGDAGRPAGAGEGDVERGAGAEPEDGADLGHAARGHRRDHLHHGPPRRLVRCVGRQRQRCRLDDRAGGRTTPRFRRPSAGGR